MNIHEWAAQECGMRIIDGIWCDKHDNGILPLGDNWTLNDARCREIVREHFWLSTYRASNSTALMDGNYWGCSSADSQYRRMHKVPVKGKTIAEAEINCIKAIWEAQA